MRRAPFVFNELALPDSGHLNGDKGKVSSPTPTDVTYNCTRRLFESEMWPGNSGRTTPMLSGRSRPCVR